MRSKFLLITSLITLASMQVKAGPPTWWSTGTSPVIDPNSVVNNHGVANIGQAKHMVKSALEALENVLPSVAQQIRSDLTAGENPIIDLSIPDPKPTNWSQNQKMPLLIGQLKAISAPFYARLHAHNPNWLRQERIANGTHTEGSIFPWTSDTSDDNNKALANVGQLKAVFSLRFSNISTDPTDTDGDGVSDQDEIMAGTDPNMPDNPFVGLIIYTPTK